MNKFYQISFALMLMGLSACSPESIAKKIREVSADRNPAPAPVVAVAPTSVSPVASPESIPANQAAPVAVPEQSQSEKDRLLQEEVNGYIQCLNRGASRVKDSRERYLLWVNEKTGPTCAERNITYGLYTLYEDGVETCQKAAQKGTVGSAMQKSAADLAAAYAELVPLVQKANDYYNQQDYKDDACAKGKLLHPQLMAAFGRYSQAQSALEASIDSIKLGLDQKELAQIEQVKGKKLAWQSKNFMINAETLLRTMPKESIASMSNAAYLSAYQGLDQAYTSLTQYLEQNPQEGKNVFWFSSFESSSKDFFTKAKFVKRDLAEGKKPEIRSLNDLIQSYNRLIGDSNNVRFQ